MSEVFFAMCIDQLTVVLAFAFCDCLIFMIVPVFFVDFMLSLELWRCRCSSDLSLSRRPRNTGLATACYWVWLRPDPDTINMPISYQ